MTALDNLDYRQADTRRQRCLGYGAVLWLLTVLFALRTAAQFVQYCDPQAWLPPFAAFQGSELPYVLLLPAQLAIVCAMLATSHAVQYGRIHARSVHGRCLYLAAAVYAAVIVLRIGIGIAVPLAPSWFHASIASTFHLVLAGYLFTLSAFHLRAQCASTKGVPA